MFFHIVPTTSKESLYVVNAVAGEGRRRRRQAAAVHQLAAGSRYLCWAQRASPPGCPRQSGTLQPPASRAPRETAENSLIPAAFWKLSPYAHGDVEREAREALAAQTPPARPMPRDVMRTAEGAGLARPSLPRPCCRGHPAQSPQVFVCFPLWLVWSTLWGPLTKGIAWQEKREAGDARMVIRPSGPRITMPCFLSSLSPVSWVLRNHLPAAGGGARL